jgi:hypothetical protein
MVILNVVGGGDTCSSVLKLWIALCAGEGLGRSLAILLTKDSLRHSSFQT